MNKIRTTPLPPYNPIGPEEAAAAAEVVSTGMLSDFIGRDGEKFLGGRYVREFEKRWAEYHRVKHAVSFNTASSALIASIGACGILPGEEVVVIGYSMCISATAPLFYDAIPVFADLEEDFFCMDPASLQRKITPRTKAILSVDLFGQSADMERINEIARRRNLKVICDAAHVPGCEYNGGFAGTFGDIGVYSLNQYKIIHCGEGGVAVTDDDDLALKLQLLRNHAEAVVGDRPEAGLRNMVGGNLRMTEVEAAIATEQLAKLPRLIKQRVELADYLTERLSQVEFLTPPKVRENSRHVYYLYPLKYHEEATGIAREEYVRRVNELGIPLYRFASGYIRPLYLEPVFSERDSLKNGFPWSLLPEAERPEYGKGTCPVTERLYEKELIVTAYTYPPLTKQDIDDIANVFQRAGRSRTKL